MNSCASACFLLATWAVAGCESPPARSASDGPPAAAAPAPAPAPPPPAPAPAPEPVATASAAPPASAAQVETAVTEVRNEITTPQVVTPDKVIATLRPKLNACYQDGLKKDPKLEGSVTLSAKIEKDGKVSAVTPKMLEGLTPAVLKCLTDHLKSASFSAAGGMSYATSIDIPLRFATQ